VDDARFAAGAGFTSGRDASDRVIYDTATGKLYYDADGSGTGDSQLVATLQGAPALKATDIYVDFVSPDLVRQGTDGNDSMRGASGNDTLNGLGGNDTLLGDHGDDSLDGGAGNDTLIGNDGADLLRGGDGDDVLDGASGEDPWGVGAEGAEPTFTFGPEGQMPLPGDTLDGGLGNDIYNAQHNDVIVDAGGIDIVFTGELEYTLGAGLENLTYQPFGFSDGEGLTVRYTGNELDNLIRVEGLWISSSAVISGGAGNDTLIGGGESHDILDGGLGNDTYILPFTDDALGDAGGIDTVVTNITWSLGLEFENLTMTGSANITMQGNNLDNLVIGNAGNNIFNARAGNDTIQAGAGDDIIAMSPGGTASYGDDVIDGGAGFDTVDFATNAKTALLVDMTAGRITGGGEAGAGSATLASVERVIGGAFNDRFTGSAAADNFDGRGGDDTFFGRGGNDRLTGGTGRDSFMFVDAPAAGGVDRITDFASGTDELVFENAAFTTLGAAGELTAGDGRFRSGAGLVSGQDTDDRLIYNTTTGNLYYDADGSGSGAAQLIATLSGAAAVAATDFTVI
jgi:Ca2+-binding RTX toxin-like protein